MTHPQAFPRRPSGLRQEPPARPANRPPDARLAPRSAGRFPGRRPATIALTGTISTLLFSTFAAVLPRAPDMYCPLSHNADGGLIDQRGTPGLLRSDP